MGELASIKARTRYDDLDAFVEGYGPYFDSDGLFVRTKKGKEVGTQVRLELQLNNSEVVFRGEGVVVEVRLPPIGTPGMRIRFSRLDRTSKELMDRILAKREIHATRSDVGLQVPSAPRPANSLEDRRHEEKTNPAGIAVPPPSPSVHEEATVVAPPPTAPDGFGLTSQDLEEIADQVERSLDSLFMGEPPAATEFAIDPFASAPPTAERPVAPAQPAEVPPATEPEPSEDEPALSIGFESPESNHPEAVAEQVDGSPTPFEGGFAEYIPVSGPHTPVAEVAPTDGGKPTPFQDMFADAAVDSLDAQRVDPSAAPRRRRDEPTPVVPEESISDYAAASRPPEPKRSQTVEVFEPVSDEEFAEPDEDWAELLASAAEAEAPVSSGSASQTDADFSEEPPPVLPDLDQTHDSSSIPSLASDDAPEFTDEVGFVPDPAELDHLEPDDDFADFDQELGLSASVPAVARGGAGLDSNDSHIKTRDVEDPTPSSQPTPYTSFVQAAEMAALEADIAENPDPNARPTSSDVLPSAHLGDTIMDSDSDIRLSGSFDSFSLDDSHGDWLGGEPIGNELQGIHFSEPVEDFGDDLPSRELGDLVMGSMPDSGPLIHGSAGLTSDTTLGDLNLALASSHYDDEDSQSIVPIPVGISLGDDSVEFQGRPDSEIVDLHMVVDSQETEVAEDSGMEVSHGIMAESLPPLEEPKRADVDSLMSNLLSREIPATTAELERVPLENRHETGFAAPGGFPMPVDDEDEPEPARGGADLFDQLATRPEPKSGFKPTEDHKSGLIKRLLGRKKR